jgi:DNA polymerase III subunit epsilon
MGGGATGGVIDGDGFVDAAQADDSQVAEDDAVAPAMPFGSAFARMPHASAKEKLHAFLEARPAGAEAAELVGLLFKGAGSDPELGARLIGGLIGGDPNFIFDGAAGMWSLRQSMALRIPLDEARFVVVDLETTGGSAAAGSIIEIGACRMEGQRITATFETLVRPRMAIPRFITGLTSITNEMVRDAPPIEGALPAFRDFLGDAVMVAHNAQFDHSFLDFEFRRLFGMGVRNPVLCTLRLSRRLLPSLKRRRLDALAEHFGFSTAGRHRGLGDARMAAELLSIFIEMAAKMGLNRLDRLIDWNHRGTAGRRLERHVPPEVIAALPRTPGVYLMRNQRGDLLYVGKAARLRDRVASYFNGGAGRNAKTAELVGHVYAIETRLARSALDAALHEARLIRELKPPYNRMLKSAAPAYFVKLDLMDPFPRLKISQKISARVGVMQLGPFIGRHNLDHAVRGLSRVLGLRTCSGKLAPDEDFSPCVYGQMGHCAAPCNLTIGPDAYNERVARAVAFLRGRSGPLMGELARAREQAVAAMRFEEARRYHRELEALAAFTERVTRLSRVVTENNLVIVIAPCAAGSAVAPSPAGALIEPQAAEPMTASQHVDDNGAASATPHSSADALPAREDSLTDTLPAPADSSAHATPASPAPPTNQSAYPVAYVILSGRLALACEIDSAGAARAVCAFVAENYDRFRMRAVARGELEAMTIVARWLRERDATDGRLIHLNGAHLEPRAIINAADIGDSVLA